MNQRAAWTDHKGRWWTVEQTEHGGVMINCGVNCRSVGEVIPHPTMEDIEHAARSLIEHARITQEYDACTCSRRQQYPKHWTWYTEEAARARLDCRAVGNARQAKRAALHAQLAREIGRVA